MTPNTINAVIAKTGQELYKEAKKLIPGGTQLLSKRPELFLPEQWPAYYSKSKGCKLWDLDGKEYTDMITMGIGACILGYADEDVNKAAIKAVTDGNMTSLNVPEEVELAKLFISLHPWADMVRYARSGGESMTIAVRIARAKTGKDKVMFCGYHGWHDWYLAANLSEDSALDGHLLPGLAPKGVPRALRGTSIPFSYNDVEEFIQKFEANKDDVGTIILETIRNIEPNKDFINAIKIYAKKNNIVFIVDEITSGWRLNVGGAHLLYDIEPDIAVFGKSVSNGFPMGVVIGKKEVMQAAQTSFISSTYWTDKIGPTTSLAAVQKMIDLNTPQRLINIGNQITQGWIDAANANHLEITTFGIKPLTHFSFVHKDALLLKTLFTQLMLDRGYLASTVLYASIAHTDEVITKYLKNVHEVFGIIGKNIQNGNYTSLLKGEVCHSGFKRLN